VLNRDEFDIGRVGDGMPDDLFRILELKPTVVRVVPTKVRVDHIVHGTDVAPTG
jgi:hypothetical protein